MSAIKMKQFSGIAPRVAPKLLGDIQAQVAHNCRLKAGRLEPVKQPLIDSVQAEGSLLNADGHCHLVMNGSSSATVGIANDAKTLFLWRFKNAKGIEREEFLTWPGIVSVAPSTLADDERGRLWIAGETGVSDSNGNTNVPAVIGLVDSAKDDAAGSALVCGGGILNTRESAHDKLDGVPSAVLKDWVCLCGLKFRIGVSYWISWAGVDRDTGNVIVPWGVWFTTNDNKTTANGNGRHGTKEDFRYSETFSDASVTAITRENGVIKITLQMPEMMFSRPIPTSEESSEYLRNGGVFDWHFGAYVRIVGDNPSGVLENVSPLWNAVTLKDSTLGFGSRMKINIASSTGESIVGIKNGSDYVGYLKLAKCAWTGRQIVSKIRENNQSSADLVNDKTSVLYGYGTFTQSATFQFNPVEVTLYEMYSKNGNLTAQDSWTGYDGVSYKRPVGTPTAEQIAAVPMFSDTVYTNYTEYIWTWVDDWGQESPPSEKTEQKVVVSGQYVEIKIPAYPSGAKSLRLYRTYNGKWRFVKEFWNAASATYDSSKDEGEDNHQATSSGTEWKDVVDNGSLGEEMPVIENAPSDLDGIIGMSSGFLVGFRRDTNEICFTEPWIPYSWPSEYRLTIDSTPVALAYSEKDIFVLTKREPYVVTGTHPETLDMQKLAFPQACVSSRAVTKLGGTIYYVSPDGLCALSSGQAPSIVTTAFFSRREWQEMKPENMILSSHDTAVFCFLGGAEDSDSMKCLIIDFADGKSACTTLDEPAQCVFSDIQNDLLYYVKKNNGVQGIYAHNSGNEMKFLKWRSKRFQGSVPTQYTTARVTSDEYTDVEANGSVTHYPILRFLSGESPLPDKWYREPSVILGNEVSSLNLSTSTIHIENQNSRKLPRPKRPERCFEFEIEHNRGIDDVIIATNSQECRA